MGNIKWQKGKGKLTYRWFSAFLWSKVVCSEYMFAEIFGTFRKSGWVVGVGGGREKIGLEIFTAGEKRSRRFTCHARDSLFVL